MITQTQLEFIYKNILTKLIQSGTVDKDRFLAEFLKVVKTYNTNIPILQPEFYYHLERMVTPDKLNNNLNEIEADMSILDLIEQDIIENISHFKITTEAELKAMRKRINKVRYTLSEVNTFGSNIINLIPNNINIENTTCEIIEDKQILFPGSFVDIYKETITPLNLSYKVLSSYKSISTEGNLNNISNAGDTNFKITITSETIERTSVSFTILAQLDTDGVIITNNNNKTYLAETNMCDSYFQLYDELIIMNTNRKQPPITITLHKDTFDDIKNGKYIYIFDIKQLQLFQKIETKSAICETNTLSIKEPTMSVMANISGNARLYLSTDLLNFEQYSFNTPISIKTANYYNTFIGTEDNNHIALINGTETDRITIKGPYGCYEYMNSKYYSALSIYSSGSFKFKNTGSLYQNGRNITDFSIDTEIALVPGTYFLALNEKPEAFITEAAYELMILHDYRFIPTDTMTDIYEIPPYTYTVKNGIVYISKVSLSNIYSVGALLSVEAAMSFLKVYKTEENNSSIVIRILIDPKSSVCNPRIVTSIEEIKK